MPYTTYGLLKAIRSHQIDSPDVAVSQATGRPNACNQCHLDRTLEWAGQKLAEWYGISPPEHSEDERKIAASVRWAISGDAGQRALMAWSMGWRDAHRAAGTDWMAPFLAQLLDDPYEAVRYIAGRSLRRLPGFADLQYDFLSSSQDRATVIRETYRLWQTHQSLAPGTRREVLVNESGNLDHDTFQRLLRARNDRIIELSE
jgi:hypothetical protein